MWSDTIVLNYALETTLYSLPVKCRIALSKTCMTFFSTLHCCSVVNLFTPL